MRRSPARTNARSASSRGPGNPRSGCARRRASPRRTSSTASRFPTTARSTSSRIRVESCRELGARRSHSCSSEVTAASILARLGRRRVVLGEAARGRGGRAPRPPGRAAARRLRPACRGRRRVPATAGGDTPQVGAAAGSARRTPSRWRARPRARSSAAPRAVDRRGGAGGGGRAAWRAREAAHRRLGRGPSRARAPAMSR